MATVVHSEGKIRNFDKVKVYLQEFILWGYRKTHPLCRGYWLIYPLFKYGYYKDHLVEFTVGA
jgi:hypothetical protein